jgi:hypothetical protein
MTQIANNTKISRFSLRLSALAMLFLCLGLLGAARASAAFEGVGHFGGSVDPPPPSEFPFEVQLGGVGGMAVNYTGNGGVLA